MGQSQSADDATRHVSPEQLGRDLALRFATKCFSPLELTHLKDNFRSLADQNDGLKYWKEETLCRFLCLPDVLGAGPIIYQMASYLGAFPFPSMAPSILTLEALVKVVVVMTERYSRILKRGRKDRIKLLFRSLAVFDRRMSVPAEKEKPTMEELVAEQKPDDVVEQENAATKDIRSHVAGFAIDEPANDEEDEDDDELALAALDSLDAIEVFKEDHRSDRKINHAQIPVDNFRRLVLLLLALAPLKPLDNIARYVEDLTPDRVKQLEIEADAIIAAFEPGEESKGITYRNFTRILSSSLPYLFEPLNSLFEHFLFSKNIDLSKRRGSDVGVANVHPEPSPAPDPIVVTSSNEESLLTYSTLAHCTAFLSTSPTSSNLYHAGTRFHSLYSIASHGTSLTSFSRQVLSWQAPTLLLVSGTAEKRQITIGAYIPHPWSKSPDTPSASPSEAPSLFLLSPRHAYFPANPYHRASNGPHTSSTAPFTYFSTKTGIAIAIGSIVPPSSRMHAVDPIPGPISFEVESDLSSAIFTYTPDEGSGAFLPDPSLPQLSPTAAAESSTHFHLPPKLTIDISSLAVYGLSTPSPDHEGDDEATKQKKRLAWEETEAERRRGVNFGGDKDGARALLEMAGLVGQNRSGGSMG